MQGQIQNAEATQEKATGENNTPSTKEQIMALEQEIAESRTAIDKDFAKKFASSISEEQQQLMFNDLAAFLESYEQAKLENLKTQLEPKITKHNELKAKLENEGIESKVKEAKEKLLAKYPKANPDEVINYLQEDLSPKQLREIDKLDPSDVLIRVYELMPQSKGKELPQELNDLHDDGRLDNEENEFMNRR
ncbi:hypothetical protein AVCANL279_07330 [Campylobacter canadensis]|uniref:hypothetical protein n=1 Tax=Campylobacter canadensis TaxID=449520 RepID=UPI001554A38F|nr:hypothetical protein [Campylobacter canadensis]MBZ7995173.1 hypothetical protein [Campylobacter canadensis]MBZ7997130.1 hypothetical protein [Campylobacter canadensis]MBZ8003848.1 hypothetical protein [Campylobacter canadensis]